MSVLVLLENSQGSFKKKSFELIQYASEIAKNTGANVTALVLGTATNESLSQLGAYGAQKILHVSDVKLDSFAARPYCKALLAAIAKENAQIIIASHDVVGRSVAPQVAAKLNAGIATGVISYPDTTNGFVVKRNVFSGKAFTFVNINTPIKVLTLLANSFAVIKGDGVATVEVFEVPFDSNDFVIQVTQTNKVAGTISLADAELVVSGGRGLKGPENWGILEDLANSLGAALACSRPVADSHWRPHHEHVGQTGGTIRPNLYIAVGISGAIQHLAGVNGSKTIVVINKDPEAPFFKAADYGIVGDAMEVVPKLTEAVNKFKSQQ